MHDFQIGDIIGYEDKKKGYVYGEIVDIHRVSRRTVKGFLAVSIQ